MRFFLIIFFLSFLGICYGGNTEMFLTHNIKKIKLKNGITLIHKYTEPLPIVSVYIFIKLGSIHDPKEKLGLTNFTQILLTKGTKKRTSQQIAIDIESIGGSIGTDADEDYSTISLSITKKYFSKAVEILSDILLNPVFPEEEFQKERVVVDAGIRSRQDHIFNVSYDLLRKNIYGEHPYAELSIGTTETIKNIIREDIVNWHKKYYGKENIIFVVVGNISLNEAKNTIEKYFSDIPEGEKPVKGLDVISPVKKEVVEKKKFEQAYLMFGFIAPEITNDDYPELKVLNTYLGSGMSSLLFQELREKEGLGYEVHSFYPSRKDKSHFVIYIGLDKSSIEKAKNKILDIIDVLKTKPVDDIKLEEAKKYLKGVYLLDHQTNSKQAWYLGWWEITGRGYQYDQKYISELKEIKPSDLQEVAKKYFIDNYVVVEIIPE